jgi:hypothetical protein
MDWLHGEMLPRFTLRNFLYYKNAFYVWCILNHLIITQFPCLFLQILFLLIWCISKNLLTCYTISTRDSPIALQELFKKTSAVHNYNTRAAKKDNFYIKYSRLELQKCSFSQLGAEIWNSIDQSLHSKSKKIFKHKMCQALFTILTTER